MCRPCYATSPRYAVLARSLALVPVGYVVFHNCCIRVHVCARGGVHAMGLRAETQYHMIATFARRTQHHRMSPAAGVSISVTVASGGVALVSNASRIAQVLDDMMERACHVALREIFVAASAAGAVDAADDAHAVLFTVTYDAPAGVHDSHHLETTGDRHKHAVGVESVPAPLRAVLSSQLSLGGAPELSADTYVLHGRARRGGGGGGPSTVVPTAVSAQAGAAMGAGWRSYQRAVALTAALGGHMGVARVEPGGYTRIWLLLPARVPQAAFGAVDEHGTTDNLAARRPTADAEQHPMPPERALTGHDRNASAVYEYPRTSSRQPGPAGQALGNAGLPFSEASIIAAAASFLEPGRVLPVHAPAVVAAALASPLTMRPRVRRVLFVDDEAVLRRLVARMLERLGVPYDALEDGSEVAGALRPEHDLILLDIVMKHSDGVQVRALRVLAYARISASMALLLFMIFLIPFGRRSARRCAHRVSRSPSSQ